ncbi:MAG: carboxypeptidase regulatory-like domain-containing protein, partial [Acidobacteriia bacterium]|nr:carboxypeptidase regulatory-like domain-containing protein [Terriglobia bacterium]
MKNLMKFLVALALLALPATQLQAQSLFATLTGVVSDPSGAVVPNATVKLINEQSASPRETVTNAEGYYSFTSVAVGNLTYKVVVSAQGFQTYQATGLAILGGEKRNLNVELTIGAATQTIEVTGTVQLISTLDSGERSQTLTTKQLTNFVQVGSNAAEFIKIMPGFGISNTTRNAANFSGEVIGINANGDAGSQSPLNNAYSYYGLPGNSLDITADGAHVSDPGCNCDTPVNPNAEMVSEFKVSTSYSAETQKGPIVISTVTKAGGSQFHGNAMFSLRNYKLNANDKLFLQQTPVQPKPGNKYYYPEGQIGGPVLIPGTSFNKNRDKLFFFSAFEYYYQVLDTGLLRATVPTQGTNSMLEGNFSAEELAKLGPITAAGSPAALNAAALVRFPGGIIPEMTPGVPGSTADLNAQLQQRFNPSGQSVDVGMQVFRVGDRVIQTRNDYDRGVMNGDLGVLTGLGYHKDRVLGAEVLVGDI